jgi:hypothetical protein
VARQKNLRQEPSRDARSDVGSLNERSGRASALPRVRPSTNTCLPGASREGAPNFQTNREGRCKLSGGGDRAEEGEARSATSRPSISLPRLRPADGFQPLRPLSANSRLRQPALSLLALFGSVVAATHTITVARLRRDLLLTGQPLHSPSSLPHNGESGAGIRTQPPPPTNPAAFGFPNRSY